MRDASSTITPIAVSSNALQADQSTMNVRLARNVLSNWTWYIVVVGSGFVIPRMIDRYAGRELLGIWDLGWSLQFFVGQVSLGINSAITQSVARARALGDMRSLNEIFSTSRIILLCCGVAGILGTGCLLMFLPYMLTDISSEQLSTAYVVVAFLCCAAIAQVIGGAFNAVLTGSERFDVLNLVRGSRDLLLLGAMILLLVTGCGMVALAAAVFVGEVACNIAKAMAARRLNPSLRWSLQLWRADVAKHLFRFGGKTVLQNVSQSGAYQLNSILLAAALGPAALALFARQRALVMQLARFVKQYAQVFVPAMSSVAAGGSLERQQSLLIGSTRLGLYVSLPFIAFLVITGGPLVELWMGPQYRATSLLIILALGHLLSIPQQGVYSILMGLNRHGWPGVIDLFAAVATALLTVLFLWVIPIGMTGAAIALVVPLTLADGIILPMYACRVLALPPGRYIKEIGMGPLLAALPLVAMLMIARLVFIDRPVGMVLASVLSLIIGVLICVFCAAPRTWRRGILLKPTAWFRNRVPDSAICLAKEG